MSPRPIPPGPPYGISVDVWVNDQLKRIERSLAELGDVTLRLEDVERLERALERAHRRNLERLAAWRSANEVEDLEERV